MCVCMYVICVRVRDVCVHVRDVYVHDVCVRVRVYLTCVWGEGGAACVYVMSVSYICKLKKSSLFTNKPLLFILIFLYLYYEYL